MSGVFPILVVRILMATIQNYTSLLTSEAYDWYRHTGNMAFQPSIWRACY